MRWPFRRRRPTQYLETRSSARPAGGAPRGRPARGDWARVAPMAPATVVAPLTVPARAFIAGLAATQPMTRPPRGKPASAQAPSGLFHLAGPVGRTGPAEPDAAESAHQVVPEGDAVVLTPLPRPRRLRVASPISDRPAPSATPAFEVHAEAGAHLTGPVREEETVVELSPPPASAVPAPPAIPVTAPPDRTRGAGGTASTGSTDSTDSTGSTGGTGGAVGARPPGRPTLGQSRRLGLGPGYHGPLPEAIRLEQGQRAPTEAQPTAEPVEAGEPASGGPRTLVSPDHHGVTGAGDETTGDALPSRRGEAPSTEPVPDEVRSELRAAYGVDVPMVHRGREVGAEARRLGARAFARGGEVYVPDEAGPLDTPEGRSIVAHELTHAAQQRRSGWSVPPEDSPAGQLLEERAQSAERHFRGDPGAPRPTSELADSRPGDDDGGVDEARALMHRLVSEGFAVSDGGGGVVFNRPAPAAPAPGDSPTGIQRQIAPAPSKPSGSTPPTPTHWNPFETLAHDVAQDFTGFAEDVMASSFGLSQDMRDDMTRSRNDAERQFAVHEFRTLRLEHRKTQFLAAHHQASVSREDERALEQEVEEEVAHRLQELESRVNRRLELLNRQHSQSPSGGTEPVHVLDPDQYQHVVRRLFGDPDGPPPPDDVRDPGGATHGGPGGHGETPGGHGTAAGAHDRAAGAHGTTPASPGADPGSKPGSSAVAASEGRRKAAGRTTGSTAAGRGTSTGHHDKTVAEGFRDIGRSILGDAVGFATSPWGIELTAEERRQILGPEGGAHTPAPHHSTTRHAAPAAAAVTAGTTEGATAGATEGATEHATHGTQPIGARGTGQASFGPSGHEQLDLEHLDLDELSAQLYERVRRQLRLELLVDRERSGLLTDFR